MKTLNQTQPLMLNTVKQFNSVKESILKTKYSCCK
jgi:hypothetical protein